MARRNSQPVFDLIEAASHISWWVCGILAILSFLGLHYVMGIPVSNPQGLQGLSASIGQFIYTTVATYLQYLLPVAFTIGGIVSFFRGRRESSFWIPRL